MSQPTSPAPYATIAALSPPDRFPPIAQIPVTVGEAPGEEAGDDDGVQSSPVTSDDEDTLVFGPSFLDLDSEGEDAGKHVATEAVGGAQGEYSFSTISMKLTATFSHFPRPGTAPSLALPPRYPCPEPRLRASGPRTTPSLRQRPRGRRQFRCSTP